MKLLWASDSSNGITGYGSVSREILSRLGPKHQIYHLGFQYRGQPAPCAVPEQYVEQGVVKQRWKLLPFTMVPRSDSPNQWDIPLSYFQMFRPDALITLGDLWHFDYMARPPHSDFSPMPRWIAYYEVDGAPISLRFKPILEKATVPVSASKFGAEAMKVHCPNATHIWHGVDTSIFTPLDTDTTNQRKDWLGGLIAQNPYTTDVTKERLKKGMSNFFVFGNVARNTDRKRTDKLFESYRLFLQDNPDAKGDTLLLVHSDVNDPYPGSQSLLDIREHLDIKDNVVFSPFTFSYYFGCSSSEMNILYNCMDVFCTATSGEGFSVPLIEAQAAGTPCIATDYTSCAELIENRGWLIPVKDWFWYSLFGIRRANVDEYKFADAMKEAYNKTLYCNNLGNQGTRWARENVDWDKCIMKQWDKLLCEVQEGKYDT